MESSFKNLVVTADDLCRIIKACANSNVREVKIGALFLAFGPRDLLAPKSHEQVETKPLDQKAQQISEESELKDLEARVRQDLEELNLSDPHAYERIIGGELGDVGTT